MDVLEEEQGLKDSAHEVTDISLQNMIQTLQQLILFLISGMNLLRLLEYFVYLITCTSQTWQ